jgi:hypothetical protein
MMNGIYAGNTHTFYPLISIHVYFRTSDAYTSSSAAKTIRLSLVRTCDPKGFRGRLTKAQVGLTIQRVNRIFIKPNFCEPLNRWLVFREGRSRPGIARSRNTVCSTSGNDLEESCLRQEKASVWTLMTGSMVNAAVSRMVVDASTDTLCRVC